MDGERWEKITSSTNDAAGFSEEDARLHEAWLGLAQSLSSSPKTWPLDPDDVYAEIVKRERRQRRSYWMRGAAVAASLLLMVAAAISVSWNPVVDRNAAKIPVRPPPIVGEFVDWEDGWEASATEVEADLVACIDLFQPPDGDAWIDRRIQTLFDDCFRVWRLF
jgi:hypothetical protein